MEVTPDKDKLLGYIDDARTGKLCLPDFQRSFIWTRDQVADLVRSVLRRYFIGSLLLLRCDPDRPPFKPVCLRGVPPVIKPRPDILVLDGQQRLSALLYALTAPDCALKDSSQRRFFFIDLEKLLEDSDDDEIVFDRSPKDLNGLDKLEMQFRECVLPCTSVMTNAGFRKWLDLYEDFLRSRSESEYCQFRSSEKRDSWIARITDFQTYLVTYVMLPQVRDDDSIAIGRICAIFEKLNSSGVDLSVYDLLTARLYRSEIKLHDLWDEACKACKRLDSWSESKADRGKFGVLVLRTLALLRNLDPKPKNLINLNPDNFEEDWRSAAAAMNRAIAISENHDSDGFGVFDKKWMPATGLLPVMAALRHTIETYKLGEGPRSELRRWYWSSVFLERYSSAVETRSRRDYSEITEHWLRGGPEPSVFVEARQRVGSKDFSIRDSATSSSSVYKGVFCMLAMAGAQDWQFGEDIKLQRLEDHHVFPKKYLHRHKVAEKSMVNTVVNRTLISDDTNGLIQDKAPSDYLHDSRLLLMTEPDRFLNPHFIDADAAESMRRAVEAMEPELLAGVYSDFLRGREQSLIRKIRKLCGVAEPAELS
ncbi:MAG: DUF262 domain-containing protein [Acidobacteria bacterium]|nr:DUF262 domain-containing protein [Acidobacteriota bacterium]